MAPLKSKDSVYSTTLNTGRFPGLPLMAAMQSVTARLLSAYMISSAPVQEPLCHWFTLARKLRSSSSLWHAGCLYPAHRAHYLAQVYADIRECLHGANMHLRLRDC